MRKVGNARIFLLAAVGVGRCVLGRWGRWVGPCWMVVGLSRWMLMDIGRRGYVFEGKGNGRGRGFVSVGWLVGWLVNCLDV